MHMGNSNVEAKYEAIIETLEIYKSDSYERNDTKLPCKL